MAKITPQYFAQIPEYFRAQPGWVGVKLNQVGDRTRKVPVLAWEPETSVDPLNRNNWCSHTALPDVVATGALDGVGFVMRKELGLVCIDIESLAKVPEEFKEYAHETTKALFQLAARERWYCQRSQSGEGYHIFLPGQLPNGRSNLTAGRPEIGIEMYSYDQYIMMTGDVVDPAELGNGARLVLNSFDEFAGAYFNRYGEAEEPEAGPTQIYVDDESLPCDLPNAEVVNRLLARGKLVQGWYTGGDITVGGKPDFSGASVALLGEIAKITGFWNQIKQVWLDSPLIHNADHERRKRAYRRFAKELTAARARNREQAQRDLNNPVKQLAKQLQESGVVEASWVAAAHERERETRAVHEQMVSQLKPAAGAKYSANTIDVMSLLSCNIPERYLTEQVAPGWTGEYMQAAYHAMYSPFLKFAIPATIAMFSGMLGRKYKLNGVGLNVGLLLFAKSGTGKSQSITAWQNYIESLQTNTFFKNRLVDMAIGSKQGFHKYLQQTPAMTWVVDECATLLQQIMDPQHENAVNIRDMVNNCFDRSVHGKLHYPSASRTSNREDEKPINNLNVSLFWGTTFDNAKKIVSKEAVETGIMSRILPVIHDKAAGTAQHPSTVQRMLPNHLGERLVQLMNFAQLVDDAYTAATAEPQRDAAGNALPRTTASPKSLLVEVAVSPEATQITDVLRVRADAIKISVHNEEGVYPSYYGMFSRVQQITERIAGVLAVVDNPVHPVVSYDHMAWSLGYTLQCLGTLSTAVDSGEMGAGLAETWSVVASVVKHLLNKPDARIEGGVRYSDLARYAMRRAPFSSAGTQGRRLIRETVDEMVLDGAFLSDKRLPGSTGLVGRPGEILRVAPHKCWSDMAHDH